MGARSNKHQLVGGKQTFNSEVQVDNKLVVGQAGQNINQTSFSATNPSLSEGQNVLSITPNAHGSGIADGAISTFVNKVGGLIYTTILIDLHAGLADGGTANDIIGTDGGAANAYIANITDSVNGVPLEVQMGCLEVPTGGDPDINLVASATATDANDAAVTSGTVVLNNGDWTLGKFTEGDAGADFAGAKRYLYLTCGDTTDAAYTAGKIIIKITGALFDKAG